MAPKKAAKKAPAKKMAHKAAHKAAKKATAKGAASTPARDLRRAYEHMGRLEALRPLLTEDAAGEIELLLRFAEDSLAAEDAKSAADLLRAGEHLAFGSLASETGDSGAEDRLRQEARTECEHLLDRAAEHWERHADARAWPLDKTYKHARRQAEVSLRQSAFRRALEYARAAEALGHIRGATLALKASRAHDRLER